MEPIDINSLRTSTGGEFLGNKVVACRNAKKGPKI